MNTDIDCITTLIDNFDHLLETAVLQRHSDQSAEFSDTVVHMYHIVTNLELLNLFQCKCHLTTTGLVTLKVIFMEAVEYLVVGEQAQASVNINKSLMQGLIHGNKLYTLFHLSKDIFQTFLLLGTVSQDIELETLQQIVLQSLRQQFKVLMEKRLWLDIEAYNGRTFLIFQQNLAERLSIQSEL